MDSVIERWFSRIALPRPLRAAPISWMNEFLRVVYRRAAYWHDAAQADRSMAVVAANLTSACPFCAAKTTRIENVEARQWSVVCGKCGGMGPLGQGRGNAIERWNRRVAAAPVSRPAPDNVTIDAPLAKIKFKTDIRDLFERFPHFRSIKSIWGSPECRKFLAGLLMDNREGTRQGFDYAATATIFALLKEHDDAFPEFVEHDRGW
jgi:hypothetical protein